MKPGFPTASNEVTSDWLESILDTRVSQVFIREEAAHNSSVIHLEVKYASKTSLPQHLLLKINKEHEGKNELQFHRFIEGLDLPMIPRRFGADHDSQSGLSYILSEDISDSHLPLVTREKMMALKGVPDTKQLGAIVVTTAQFHAAFWEHQSLGTIPDTTEMHRWYRDTSFHEKHVEKRTGEWKEFIRMFGRDVPGEWIELGGSALERLPRLFETRIKPRLGEKRALTMSQGGCYLTEFLVPRAGLRPVYLVDFQNAGVNFPAYDLVYMFGTFWTRQQRSKLEERLLSNYLTELQTSGIDYSWENLCEDYKVCLSYMLFDAVSDATAGSPRDSWFPKLHCLIDAYQDWDCASL